MAASSPICNMLGDYCTRNDEYIRPRWFSCPSAVAVIQYHSLAQDSVVLTLMKAVHPPPTRNVLRPFATMFSEGIKGAVMRGTNEDYLRYLWGMS